MADRSGRRIEVVAESDEAGWICAVAISEPDGTTQHRVRVSPAVLGRLAPGAADPVRLVRISFEFLLDREPKESILAAFDLPLIGRYFPEYEAAMLRRAEADR